MPAFTPFRSACPGLNVITAIFEWARLLRKMSQYSLHVIPEITAFISVRVKLVDLTEVGLIKIFQRTANE